MASDKDVKNRRPTFPCQMARKFLQVWSLTWNTGWSLKHKWLSKLWENRRKLGKPQKRGPHGFRHNDINSFCRNRSKSVEWIHSSPNCCIPGFCFSGMYLQMKESLEIPLSLVYCLIAISVSCQVKSQSWNAVACWWRGSKVGEW